MRLFRKRDESGFTIAELTIGAGLMLLVTFGALSVLNSASRATRFSNRETQSIDDAQVALDRMVSEIRQSATVYAATGACPTSTCLIYVVELPAGGTTGVRWKYVSASSTLVRALGDPLTGDWGTDRTVVSGVVNGTTPVFCRAAPCTVPSERAIQVTLLINSEPTRPTQVVRLYSYVSPRNL